MPGLIRRGRAAPARAGALLALALLLGLGAVVLPAASTRAAAGAPLPKPRTEAPDGSTPLDLVSASAGQVGTDLRISMRTAKPFLAADLVPGTGRSLCVQLRRTATAKMPDRQLCAVADATAASGLRLRLTHLDARGRPAGFRNLRVRVVRPDHHTVVAAVPYASIGLVEGRQAWQAVSHWRDGRRCQPVAGAAACVDDLPDAGAAPFALAAAKVVGCEYKGPQQVHSGSGNRVALTFDDGPAAITAQFLDVLEREHVPATFFMIGREVAGREALLRRMLADGDMIGNHSWDHANLGAGGPAAASEISRTNTVIHQATGFTPCLFRPPYGATSPALVETAGAQRVSTILWDVDPSDWSNPGTGAIVSRVLAQAHPGAIVLDHDGGGPRGQTLAALPAIIHEFKRRGYRFVTVNDMLGLNVVRG